MRKRESEKKGEGGKGGGREEEGREKKIKREGEMKENCLSPIPL